MQRGENMRQTEQGPYEVVIGGPGYCLLMEYAHTTPSQLVKHGGMRLFLSRAMLVAGRGLQPSLSLIRGLVS